MSVASSYQLHERYRSPGVGSRECLAMERDAHYRRGDGMRCFLPELGESERFLDCTRLTTVLPKGNLVEDKESRLKVYDVPCG